MNRRRFLTVTAAMMATAPLAFPLKPTVTEASILPPQDINPLGVGTPPSHWEVPSKFRLKTSVERDPLSQNGSISYKVTCSICLRQWGEWQKFSDTMVDLGFVIPGKDDVRSRAIERVVGMGFAIDPDDVVICPGCANHGAPEPPIVSLTEGFPPIPTPWYQQYMVVLRKTPISIYGEIATLTGRGWRV